MAAQWSEDVRDAWIDVTETTIGTAPILKIRSGSKPANCAAADQGTVLATITLPSDWLSAPSAGVSGMVGTWEDDSTDDSGIIGHFRLYDSGGTTCHLQGTATLVGSGGDMTVNSAVVTAGSTFTINSFTATASGA